MLPGTVTSDTDLVAELIGNELGHLPEEASDDRDLERALAKVLPRLEGAFSLVVMDESPRHRRPRPERVPSAVPRQARPRVGAGVGEPGARHRRRPLRARARPRRDGRHRRHRAALAAPLPGRARRPSAVPLRVRLLRPPGHAPLQPERPPGPHPHRRAARRAGAGRGGHGHGRARVGGAGRRGLRPSQRDPVRPGRGEEPLHRPQLHRPEPGAPGAGGAHEAQPAARERRRASASSSSTTPSSAAPRRSSSPRCSARPAPPRCTCASPRRR